MNAEYREALVRVDEISLMIGHTLSLMRIGWDCQGCTADTQLKEINALAAQLGEAIPDDIKATRTRADKRGWAS